MGGARYEKGGQAEYTRGKRRAAVKNGLCGYCHAKLGRYKWLCDSCAAEHRERQRREAWARRANKLLGIAATWTAPFPLRVATVEDKPMAGELYPFGATYLIQAGGPWEAKFIFCGTYGVHPSRVTAEPALIRPGFFDVTVAPVPGAVRPPAAVAPDVCPRCASQNVIVGCFVLECLECGWHHLNQYPCTVCGSPAFSFGKLPGKPEVYGCREHPVTDQWGIDVEKLRAEWQEQFSAYRGAPADGPRPIVEAPVIYGDAVPVIENGWTMARGKCGRCGKPLLTETNGRGEICRCVKG